MSSLESRSSEYVSIHQKVVRDVCFNSRGDKLLLSASMDKSLKLTSMASNTVVQRYFNASICIHLSNSNTYTRFSSRMFVTECYIVAGLAIAQTLCSKLESCLELGIAFLLTNACKQAIFIR